MMQADEIIENKEWQDLSQAEKEAIKEIVADEQEFNMLKKMILMAGGEPDVPAVDNSLQVRLQAQVNPTKKAGSKVWYYAAAAVVAGIIFTTVLLTKQHKTGESLVHTPLKKEAVKTTQPTVVLKDSIVEKTPQIVVRAKPAIKPKAIIKQKIKTATIPVDIDLMATAYVKDNQSLLQFVTEVY